MIKTLSQKMDKKNFECFTTNYETLIKLKENKTLWASAMSFVKNEVFTKNIFDSIELKKRQLQSFDSLVKSRFRGEVRA